MYTIYFTEEYKEWLKHESLKSQRQILKRLENIEDEGHFGHINNLEKNGD